MPKPVPAIMYRTLHATEPADLDAQIMRLLTQGWSLWGSPYAMPGTDRLPCAYCQAMIQLFED